MSKKQTERRERHACFLWDHFQEMEPDLSTERLLAMIGGQCRMDDSEVVDALIKGGLLKEGRPA